MMNTRQQPKSPRERLLRNMDICIWMAAVAIVGIAALLFEAYR